MPLIRVKDLVPDVYESTSRDFQLISNLKTCVFSATKEDIDSIVDIINTEHCPDRLLPLLQSRLGFITDKEFDNRTLRIALSVFPYLIKNKGTLKAIKQAVYAFLKINNLNTRTYVEVNNKVDYGYIEVNQSSAKYKRKYVDNKQPYTIKIGIESTPRDITILKELFKYILPPGYDISFFFFSGVDEGLTTDKLIFNDSAEVIAVGDGVNSAALSYGESAQYDIVAKHTVTAGDTFETIKYEDIGKTGIKVEKEDVVQNTLPDVIVKTKARRGRKKVNKDAN